jgi:hypothetical protein
LIDLPAGGLTRQKTSRHSARKPKTGSHNNLSAAAGAREGSSRSTGPAAGTSPAPSDPAGNNTSWLHWRDESSRRRSQLIAAAWQLRHTGAVVIAAGSLPGGKNVPGANASSGC